MTMDQDQPSRFLRLPTEIRLEIYKHLLFPSDNLSKSFPTTGASRKPKDICLTYYEYELHKNKPHDAIKLPVLGVRILDPNAALHAEDKALIKRRNRFAVRNHYRGRTQMTTYRVWKHGTGRDGQTGFISPTLNISTTFLATCRQIHAEAAHLLYSTYHFDFSTHIEAIEPFFRDMTPYSRSCIRSLSITKRPLPYDRDFDASEWACATTYLARNLPGLRVLDLGVVAGMPPSGWDMVPDWTRRDYECLIRMRGWECSGLEWVRQVLGCTEESLVEGSGGHGWSQDWKKEKVARPKKRDVKVRVRSIVEACPPASNSERLAFWIGLSKSLEKGFVEWIGGMIEEGH